MGTPFVSWVRCLRTPIDERRGHVVSPGRAGAGSCYPTVTEGGDLPSRRREVELDLATVGSGKTLKRCAARSAQGWDSAFQLTLSVVPFLVAWAPQPMPGCYHRRLWAQGLADRGAC